MENNLKDLGAIVMPFFTGYTGRKKLSGADLKLPAGTELPPGELASLGTKKTIDPKQIRLLEQPRDRAHAACSAVGVKLKKGVYFVPKDKLTEVCRAIEEQIAVHKQRSAMFLDDYERIIDAWCNDNPVWEDIIRISVDDKKVVERKLSADFLVLPYHGAHGFGEEQLDSNAMGMSDALLKEIATDASKFFDESIKERNSKDGVTQKALRPIRSMRSKLEGLAFLSGEIRPIVDEIDAVLEAMPKTGRIDGHEFSRLMSLSLILSDQSKLLQLGRGLLSSSNDLMDVTALSLSDIDVPNVEVVDDWSADINQMSDQPPMIESVEIVDVPKVSGDFF